MDTENLAIAPAKSRSVLGGRWLVMSLAFFITIVNYMDRSAISYAIEPIKREFHLTDGEFGFIFGAFGMGYIFSTFLGGIIVDRFGARKVWSIAAVSWSIMTALLGIASGFWPLMIFRTLLGITEGPSFPSLSRTVADWLPMSERARAMAFTLVAVPLANVFGAPFISHLVVTFGWKVMFLVLASLGLGWAAIWVVVFRDYPENSRLIGSDELAHIREGKIEHEKKSDDEIRAHRLSLGKTTIVSLLKNPALISNNFGFFSFGCLLFFAIHWLPDYLQDTFSLPLEQVGYMLIFPWLTAATMLFFTGWLSDYLWHKTGSVRISRSHLIWVCQVLSVLCFLPIVQHPSLEVAMVCLSLGLGFGLAPNAAFYALNADLAGDRAATSLGLMCSCTATAAIIAPAITGVLKQITGGFNAAFILMIAFTSLSAIGIFLFQHPDKQLEKERVISPELA